MLLLTVGQFQISKTSNGGVSCEICIFLEQCSCRVMAATFPENFLLKLFYLKECNSYNEHIISFIYIHIHNACV